MSRSAGDELVIVESMKMEIPIEAPHDGSVLDIAVAEGHRCRRATSSSRWMARGRLSQQVESDVLRRSTLCIALMMTRGRYGPGTN